MYTGAFFQLQEDECVVSRCDPEAVVCVCVCVRESERVRESVCLCVCVCV